jgi:hypothetical protein
MERQRSENRMEILHEELTRETYRYELALRDGAVDSIVSEVIKKINELESELSAFKMHDRRSPGNS